MNKLEYEEFESELGNVAVSKEHVEREHRESDRWEKIKENFLEEQLLERANYRDIEDIKFVEGEIFPHIRMKIDDSWRRLFFTGGDDVEGCFKLLKYRLNAYRQNHQ